MDILTILRIGGYMLLGLGTGYWLSILVTRVAAIMTVRNRCRMAVLGCLIGACVAVSTIAVEAMQAPPLEQLTTNIQLDRALATASGTPIVLSFYANWCPPSGRLAPTLEQAQRRWGGRAKFYKVDVDESVQLRDRFDIRSVPTLVFFHGKAETDRTIGMVGPKQIDLRVMKLIETAEAASRRTAMATNQDLPKP